MLFVWNNLCCLLIIEIIYGDDLKITASFTFFIGANTKFNCLQTISIPIGLLYDQAPLKE